MTTRDADMVARMIPPFLNWIEKKEQQLRREAEKLAKSQQKPKPRDNNDDALLNEMEKMR